MVHHTHRDVNPYHILYHKDVRYHFLGCDIPYPHLPDGVAGPGPPGRATGPVAATEKLLSLSIGPGVRGTVLVVRSS
jgi:hypothetical protein